MPLRETFDEAAELYDRARPGYPATLFSDLAELACIGPGCRVLEIGCGTGQATIRLAERGCEIVCVELGTSLAAVARPKLARFRTARVEVAAFEAWPLPAEPFDTVVAATAFHWIDPSVRVTKAAQWQCEADLLALAQPSLDAEAAAVPQAVLCRRIHKYLPELFTFLGDPAFPSTNNAAERSIRPAVCQRKISGGTRSPEGTRTFTTLATLFGTWRARGLDPLVACRTLLDQTALASV